MASLARSYLLRSVQRRALGPLARENAGMMRPWTATGAVTVANGDSRAGEWLAAESRFGRVFRDNDASSVDSMGTTVTAVASSTCGAVLGAAEAAWAEVEAVVRAALDGSNSSNSPMPALAGGWAVDGELSGLDRLRGSMDGQAGKVDGLSDALESLQWNQLLAVPKRKTSYMRKRIRQNAREKQLRNIHHFYPCTKCEKGLLKLRHHLCPCDMEKVNMRKGVVTRVAYGNAGQPQGSAAGKKKSSE